MENYISLQKSQLLDSLENQVRFSQLVAVLVGEKGIGKSYTLEQLQKRLGEEICIAHIDAKIEIQEDQLQKVICLQLGLPSESLDEIEQIEKSIRSNLRKKALISIDNAHLLSNESLNSLLQLNQSQINHQESVLFLLLTGDESLPKNISFTDTFKAHQEMCVVFQLEPIEKSEVASLVAAISQLSLDEVDETYGSKQLEYFWQLSKGIPAELEYQVSRWQSEKPEEYNDLEDIAVEDSSYWRAITYLILAVVFVSILFYQDEINQMIMPHKASIEAVKDEGKQSQESERKTKKIRYKGRIEQEQDKEVEQAKVTNNNENFKEKIAVDAVDISKKLFINEANISESDESLIEKNNSKKQLELESSGLKSGKLKHSDLKQAELKTTTKIVPPRQANDKLSDKNIQIKAESTKAAFSTLSKDEQFLLAQPSSYLSLQWVGVSQLENAQTFRSNHPLKARMYIYRRKQANDGVLYLVVSDLFSSRSEANTAKEKYKKLKSVSTPWIKSLSAIQNEIKR